MKLLRATILAAALVLGGGAALAQDFYKGLEAAQAGDFATALKEWQPLAEQGDAGAQNNLGAMHGSGKGVPQDHVMAHMWYNIAAANGVEDAPVFRDEIAAEMTSSDISKAQAMARECMSGGYKNCGW